MCVCVFICVGTVTHVWIIVQTALNVHIVLFFLGDNIREVLTSYLFGITPWNVYTPIYIYIDKCSHYYSIEQLNKRLKDNFFRPTYEHNYLCNKSLIKWNHIT